MRTTPAPDASPAAVCSPTADAVAVPVAVPPPAAADLRVPCAWDLGELLPDVSEPVVEREIAAVERLVEEFAAERERLSPTMEPAAFLEILRRYEQMLERIDILAGYSSLWFSADTQAAAALSFRNRIRQLLARLDNRILFFSLWWKELGDAEAERLLPTGDDTRAADFRHYLRELRRFRPYTLDERAEQVVNLKNANGIEAVKTIYSMLTNRLEFTVELEGERRTLTEDQMRSLFHSPEPETRATVYRELFRVYEREAPVLAQIYATRVRDWHTEQVELRGFASPISVRNVANDIPDPAVDTLLEVIAEHAPLFHDYFRLKAGWLGLEPLRRYDLYAPLARAQREIPYGEAVDEVLTTFRGFDPRLETLARRVFDERHIDSEIRKGKRSGAFCATLLPRFAPWVLVNYAGRVRDVATLAHELGHAVHSLLAAEHSVLTQHPSLPLAETASVFAEILMTDRLLARVEDRRVRRELLASAVDDVYATVMRQAYFVRFERAAHQAVLDNRSAEDLHELYFQHLQEQFGESMTLAPEFRYEWVSIPHIFQTPFYCYAYSFGQLLVLALYKRYQEEGEAFKPGYLRLLAHGGSAPPTEILGELGIDVADADFWRGGFAVVASMIDELRALGD